jgi:hypothetical protein
VLEEHVAYTLRVEEEDKEETSVMKAASSYSIWFVTSIILLP